MNSKKYSNSIFKNKTETINKSQVMDSTQVESDEMSLTDKLIRCISENNDRSPRGRRYKKMKNYFTLLSFMGPHYYGLLHDTLLFPSYRTVQSYRNLILDKMGIKGDIFNGKNENIEIILKNCLPLDFNSKVIIALDAAYITPYVAVYCNGRVDGLINRQNIDIELALKLIEDEDEFATFISSNEKNIISAEFVLMFIPIDASHRAFPICTIPAIHGTSTENILEKYCQKISFLETQGINVIGFATDGDRQYSSFSMDLMNYIIEDINEMSKKSAFSIMDEYPKIFHFSDPFHLVKRDRYRKVSKESFIVDPWNEAAEYSVDNLYGLDIPSYVLSIEQSRKMEDCLPLKLFSINTLLLIADTEDYGLFFSMLPSTLLMESIHSKSLSRKLRIEYLMIGSSLMILYEFYKKNDKKFKRKILRN